MLGIDTKTLGIDAKAVKTALIRFHPGYRRFQKFLRGLPLDPDALPDPLPAPSPRDFVICGCSRTGTSLLAALLFQPPRALTVVEPWDGMRLPPQELFASLRSEIAATGALARGTLDLGAVLADGRVKRVAEGQGAHAVELASDGLLGVKWPGYYRFIERLPETKFLVCLRHPLDVIASFKAIGGSVAEGLDYDMPFNRAMNRTLREMTSNAALRRVYLFDYVHSRLVPLLSRPNVHVVRYERWFSDPAGELAAIGAFLEADLGAPRTKIQPENRRQSGLTLGEIEIIRRECSTAKDLGYSLAP